VIITKELTPLEIDMQIAMAKGIRDVNHVRPKVTEEEIPKKSEEKS
jgi:hypothetical protein